jgi:hypothetical protein
LEGEKMNDFGNLVLYACTACGFVSMRNFRDDCCAVCQACEKVEIIVVMAAIIRREPAPHQEDDGG